MQELFKAPAPNALKLVNEPIKTNDIGKYCVRFWLQVSTQMIAIPVNKLATKECSATIPSAHHFTRKQDLCLPIQCQLSQYSIIRLMPGRNSFVIQGAEIVITLAEWDA
jgi:hypothetical protein